MQITFVLEWMLATSAELGAAGREAKETEHEVE
jgi:hypothetical protein